MGVKLWIASLPLRTSAAELDRHKICLIARRTMPVDGFAESVGLRRHNYVRRCRVAGPVTADRGVPALAVTETSDYKSVAAKGTPWTAPRS